MTSFIFGETTSGLPIPAYEFGRTGTRVLILGGVHGDEIEGVWAAHGLLAKLSDSFSLQLQLTLVPALNLDGVLLKQRQNARGVDLNRNMPTKDWSDVTPRLPDGTLNLRYHPGPKAGSEPETQALMRFLETKQPQFILSLHSWKPMLNVNGACRPEAQAIASKTGYIIEESIGYPTPGCLGTYSGIERNMPTLTYEIERGLKVDSVLSIHVPAILSALKASEAREPNPIRQGNLKS